MKLLVLGASGRVGRHLCSLAVKAGHQVRGFSRSVEATGMLAGIEAVQGDVLDRERLAAALEGMDVVVSSIGMDRGSDFPWARIRVPRDIHSSTAAVLVKELEAHGPRRLILVSAHGVGESWSRIPLPVRALIASSSIGVAYEDLGRAEEVFRKSALDWTAVRPTVLANGAGTGRWRAEPELSAGLTGKIPREDVARFLLEVAESGSWSRTAVSITAA